jgi:hypothetical protein
LRFDRKTLKVWRTEYASRNALTWA